MNEQLDPMEPVDPIIRAQLARRSAGRLPEGLEDEISNALDDTRKARSGVSTGRPLLALTTPRLAGAGLGVALVAILAVAIVAPVLNRGIAGPGATYPYGRAMTTAELVTLLANPPAINTTVVVASTIDIRSDVCPMNRYPTTGVIAGVEPQICVMQGSLPPILTGTSATGTFAFRYLGGRSFGLLGQVAPKSDANPAWSVGDSWPLAGKTFLVDGWFSRTRVAGNDPALCLSDSIATAGDVLNPNGADTCGVHSWLSAAEADGQPSVGDSPSYLPHGVASTQAPGATTVEVEAAGAAQIDGFGSGGPVRGLFVVRSVVEGCPNESPQSSVGCMAWRILAKVDESVLARPSASPSAFGSSSVSSGAPTTPQLPSPQATGPLAPAMLGLVGPDGRPLTANELNALWAANPSGVAGRLAIVNSNGGYQVVRVQSNGTLSSFGSLPDTNGLPLPLSAAQPNRAKQPGELVLVDAYLDWVPGLECDTPPYPSDSLCGAGALTSVLTSAPLTSQGIGNPHIAPFPSGVYGFEVALGAYQIYGSSDPKARPIHGLFLLSGGVIVARMVPTTPVAGSSGLTGSAPTGLIGPNNTALTPSQLLAALLRDQYRLNGRYVIDMRVSCDATDCTGVKPKATADLIQPDGSADLVGQLDLAEDGGVVWKVPQAAASWDHRFVFIVDAWISGGGGGDACDVVGMPCDSSTRLGSGPNARELTAQAGAITKFAPPGNLIGGAGRGLFLVTRVDTGKTCGGTPTMAGADCSPQVEILARLEPATLP